MAYRTALGTLVLLLAGPFTGCLARSDSSPSAAVPSNEHFDEYLHDGTVALTNGDYNTAITQLRLATQADGNSAKAHNLLGLALFQNKQYRSAAQSFLRTLEIDPRHAAACSNLGAVYFLYEEYENAREMLSRAIALAPDLVAPYYSLGSTLIALGRPEEGTAYMARGIELDPAFLEKNPSLVTSSVTPGIDIKELYLTYARLYAAKASVEKALMYLEKAEQAGVHEWAQILAAKEFDNVREDERFQAFAHK